MATSACPFCFATIDTAALAFQCSGRPKAGAEPCAQAEDELRLQRTSSKSLTFPTFVPSVLPKDGVATCPECEGPARRRACPVCHTVVPESFVGSDSPMLGIVGSKGSGKTVLMTVLTRQLRGEVGRRFDASVRFATDNPDGFDGVGEYTRTREDSMFQEGRLPMGTLANVQERRRPVVMMWQAEVAGRLGGRRLRSTTLSFIDSAGEDFNRLEDAYSLQYLTSCDGLMIALDPFGLPGARASITLPQGAAGASLDSDPLQVLERITDVLRTEHGVNRKKRIKIPLAVVFTKIDAFFTNLPSNNPVLASSGSTNCYDEADGLNVHEHMRSLLQEWGADEVDLHLRLNYDDFRLFGVSALGAQPIYAESRVAPGGVRPHRVEDPVLWLLAKEGMVKRG